MVNVKIDEDTLLGVLIDRLEQWTSDEDIIALYKNYYEDLINCGCFEGMEFNPMVIVDNDWINNTSVIGSKEFENYGIESIEDDRILYRNDDKDLYLIQAY